MTAGTSTGHLIHFCIFLDGKAHVHQHDRVADLAAGSAVISETRSPWELVAPATTRTLTLHISREMLPLHGTAVTEACARPWTRRLSRAASVRLSRPAVGCR
ncbi:hypothetical protein [Pseudonocardia alaniniphila]